MAEEHKNSDKDLQPNTPDKSKPVELDAAGKSLSEALGISFVILKVIMAVLILAFLASGFKTVVPTSRPSFYDLERFGESAKAEFSNPGPGRTG